MNSTIVVVTGVSGSGKSTAAKALEDLGYYCVDNLPVALLGQLVAYASDTALSPRLAIILDARACLLDPSSASPESFVESIRQTGRDVSVLFLDAQNDVLVRRFSETRRRHPLAKSNETTLSAIGRERELVAGLRAVSSLQLDTSRLTVHDLRTWVRGHFAEAGGLHHEVSLLSFGYKYGIPVEADYLFDVRFLPNPHFIDALRPQTGQDEGVVAFMEQHTATRDIVAHMQSLLDFTLPLHEMEGRAQVTIGVGCTGGQHRSVYCAERLAERLRSDARKVSVLHRDMIRQARRASDR